MAIPHFPDLRDKTERVGLKLDHEVSIKLLAFDVAKEIIGTA